MPRFHFNVRDGALHPDHEGTVLPSLASARVHASLYAGDLLKSDPYAVWNEPDWQMEITDERGLVLLLLSFSAVDMTAKPPVRRDHE